MSQSEYNHPGYLEGFITGGVWRASSVADQPRSTLRRWSVYETDRRELHLVGWCEESCEGRVSSTVNQFDPQARTFLSRSGRVYLLDGPPGRDPDAEWVWGYWARTNHVKSTEDRSLDFARAMAASDGAPAQAVDE